MRNLYILVIISAVLFVVDQAHALRCGNVVIKEDDSILKVLEYCGQPLYSDYINYHHKLTKLYIYKQNRLEQRIYLRAGRVVGVN